jgi:hypothetical protein
MRANPPFDMMAMCFQTQKLFRAETRDPAPGDSVFKGKRIGNDEKKHM